MIYRNSIYRNALICIAAFALSIIIYSCGGKEKTNIIVIFHAGSLAVPFNEIIKDFKKENPGIEIYAESSGSLAAARKITELNKPCDILAVSDYMVINKLLIPAHAKKNIVFATNEMVIAYTDKSLYNDSINSDNWYEILKMNEVTIGRSEPNADPCGYRSLFVFKLAELYYNVSGLSDRLTNKEKTIIRPKEVDLLALTETANVDYLLIYKSVAIQHNLKYISLPDEINLSNSEFENTYQKVNTIVNGSVAGEKTSISGTAIQYSYCIPENSENPEAAAKFIAFMCDKNKGGKILEKNGMKPISNLP